MADEKKAKHGDTVLVTISKRKKKALETPADDRRYGPPPFPDEVRRRRKKGITEIHFINQQSEFSRTNLFRSLPEQELKYQHKWNSTPFDFPGFLSLGKTTNVRRYFSSGVGDFVVYRQAWDKHPLPYTNANDYGITLKLGGQTKALAPANSEWKAYSPYDTQADLLERQANGEDVTAELVNNAYEIEEWEATFQSPETYWIEPNVLWHRNYGFYRKRLSKRSTYAIENTGIAFEAFDPFDTVNYKVTEGDFSAAEVAAPQLDPKQANDLRIGLIPRRWQYTLTYTGWFYQDIFSPVDSRIWQHENTFDGEMWAITLPYYEYLSGGEINEFEIQETEYAAGLFSGVTHNFSSLETDGIPAPFDQTYLVRKIELSPFDIPGLGDANLEDGDFGNDPDHPGNTRVLFERSDATIAITEKDLSAGDLVGLFSTDAGNFYVWRKTSAARGASIYSGGYDSISSNLKPAAHDIAVFDNYINPSWQSRSRDFTYFDPLGDYTHLVG